MLTLKGISLPTLLTGKAISHGGITDKTPLAGHNLTAFSKHPHLEVFDALYGAGCELDHKQNPRIILQIECELAPHY